MRLRAAGQWRHQHHRCAGDNGGTPDNDEPQQKPQNQPDRRGQDPGSPVQVIGGDKLSSGQQLQLTDSARRSFAEP
jgi:hypothetical protein